MRDIYKGFPSNASRVRRIALLSLLVGIASSVVWFFLAGHIGFDLADEGYLWYGAQRMLHGEMPIRDFVAYDLGRYVYVAAFLSAIQDTGLMTTRVAAYSLIGLLVALTVFIVVDGTKTDEGTTPGRVLFIVAVAALAVLWVYPYYKVFDHVASVLVVLAVYVLMVRRTGLAWHLLGICVGVIAMIGRNHGIYGVAASVLAFVVLMVSPCPDKPDVKNVGAWILGILVGYLPMFGAMLFVEGFGKSFVSGVLEMLRVGETNLARPVPWPWKLDIAHQGMVMSLQPMAEGFGFLLLLAFPIFGAAYLFRNKSIEPRNAAFAAAWCVALPYVHYAFSRADATHLGLSVYPVLIGLLTLKLKLNARIALASMLVLYTATVLFESPPINYRLTSDKQWKTIKVRNDAIIVWNNEAQYFSRLIGLIEEHAAEGSFLALPDMTSLHAIYETRMPIHSLYVIFPVLESYEDDEIRRLTEAKPRLILVANNAIDKNESLKMSNLRPRMYRWINENYRRSISRNELGRDAIEVYVLDSDYLNKNSGNPRLRLH